MKEIEDKYYLSYNIEDIDFTIVNSIHYQIIAGVIVSMALKHAGTGDI